MYFAMIMIYVFNLFFRRNDIHTHTHTRTQENNNKSWPDKQSWLIPTDRPVDFPFFNIWWWFTNTALAKIILQESNLQASSTFLQHSININKANFCQLLAPAMWPTGAQQTTGYHGGRGWKPVPTCDSSGRCRSSSKSVPLSYAVERWKRSRRNWPWKLGKPGWLRPEHWETQ